MLISRTLRLFLDSIGRREEYEFYLNKFQKNSSVCFALVAPDAGSLQQSGDLLAFDLQFLLQLGLTPMVLLTGSDTATSLKTLARHLPLHVIDGMPSFRDSESWRKELGPALAAHQLPVVVEPTLPLSALVPLLAPALSSRVHLLRLQGMLHSLDGEKIFYHCTQRANVHRPVEEDAEVLAMATDWLNQSPTLHISVASPLNLLQEMFTVRGMGSIIRPGSTLHHLQREQVDMKRLLSLFSEAFGKTLRNASALASISDYCIEEHYRGAALLETHPAGKYLSKFAVGTQARGEGLAQDLWEAACASQPHLFWRARYDNPINQWYSRHATGVHTEGEWKVFWVGIDADALPEIIHYALDRESDFVEDTL